MENNKSNKGLVGLVIVLIILVLGLGGYIVYDKVLNKDKETNQVQKVSEPTVTPTEESTAQNNCDLYKFDNTYQLTDSDKKEIAESIEKMKAMNNEKVDINTIKVTGVNDYYLFTSFETVNKEGNYEFGALVFKVNNTFKCWNIGSGYTKQELEGLDYTFSRICS